MSIQRFLYSAQRTLTRTSLPSLRRIMRFSEPPILLGGCGRSGTTLLLSILAAHPHIAAIPHETALFARLAKKRFPGLRHRVMVARAQLLLAREDIGPLAHRWCEKTPRNVRALPRLLRHFGSEVRFVHLVRDGRDLITSRHPRHDGPYVPVERWVRDVSAGLRFRDDPRVYTLRYEDLVKDTDTALGSLLEWLGEPFAPELRQFETHTSVTESRAWSHRVRPLSGQSIGRWRDPRYADEVAALMADPEAVRLLQELGYPLS